MNNHWYNEGKEYLRKDDNGLQGRTRKQYKDSAKIFLIAAIGLFTLMAFSVLYNLIFG